MCGLKGLEAGVEAAFAEIAEDWAGLRETLRASGRYHVETY
jgi:benzoyl-CoA 2,3-dioxygenase component A